jgi:hypothetical protein
MALHPQVLAEIEQERAARRAKAEEVSAQKRCAALDARLTRVEAACNSPAPEYLNEKFWAEVGGVLRESMEGHIRRLKAEIAVVAAQVKFLQDQPQLKYVGVWESGQNYERNSLCTRDGSLWIAKSNTGSCPGNPGGSDWRMVCKRGRDGKDGKDGRDGKDLAR